MVASDRQVTSDLETEVVAALLSTTAETLNDTADALERMARSLRKVGATIDPKLIEPQSLRVVED